MKMKILIFVLAFNLLPDLSGQDFDFELKNVYPKLITPAQQGSDNLNDFVFFRFKPNYKEFRLKIFNLEGRNIVEIPASNSYWKPVSGKNEYFIRWDCRDSDKQLVEPGVYLYMVETDNKTFSGVITIAR